MNKYTVIDEYVVYVCACACVSVNSHVSQCRNIQGTVLFLEVCRPDRRKIARLSLTCKSATFYFGRVKQDTLARQDNGAEKQVMR